MYDNYRNIIEQKGMTSYYVAKCTGISRSTFSEWKSGRSKPKIDKLKKIAEFLDVSLEELVGQ